MRKHLHTMIFSVLALAYMVTPVMAQNTSETYVSTEREFDDDFKERYSGRKYDYEGKDVVGYTRGGSGEYSDYKTEDQPELEERNNGIDVNSSLETPFLNWLLIGVLIAAVLYLVYILLNEGGNGLFSSNRDRKIEEEEELTVENIGQIDIRSLIQKAEKEGNYRLAVRYNYILVLKTLSLNNFIKLEDDKTNEEYYNEIKSQPFSKGFSYTSYLYNYVWYGEFPIDHLQYNKAKSNFDNLINTVA